MSFLMLMKFFLKMNKCENRIRLFYKNHANDGKIKEKE